MLQPFNKTCKIATEFDWSSCNLIAWKKIYCNSSNFNWKHIICGSSDPNSDMYRCDIWVLACYNVSPSIFFLTGFDANISSFGSLITAPHCIRKADWFRNESRPHYFDYSSAAITSHWPNHDWKAGHQQQGTSNSGLANYRERAFCSEF